MSTDTNQRPSVSDRVREARKSRLLSQDQLAVSAGVSVSSVARLERGDPVSPETLKSVSAVLDLDAVSLAAPVTPLPAPTPPSHPGRASLFGRMAVSIVCLTLLALFGVEVGLQAAYVSNTPQREALQGTMYAIEVHNRATEISKAAGRYSSLIPADSPDRQWEPWNQARPFTWLSCVLKGSGLAAWVHSGDFQDLFGIGACRDVGIAQVTMRRDETSTEFLLGPMPVPAARTLVSLLTPDPSVGIGVLVTEGAEPPGPVLPWVNPRLQEPSLPAEGHVFTRIRLGRASR